MTVTVTVTTTDAAPTVAPFKVSAKPGFNIATVTIATSRAIGIDPSYSILAYKLKRGGTAVTNGVQIAARGVVTGLDRCNAAMPAEARRVGVTFVEQVDFADFAGGADGDYPMNVYVYTDSPTAPFQ